ncbi:MAG: Omp28-related outer membrane protein [Bacteroidales bacterium]|nr:Omp28-related outer membrane protein [Bacteroidales bacterium]
MKISGIVVAISVASLLLTFGGCTKSEQAQLTNSVPAVESHSISNITATGASGGGYVSKDGGSAVTARGLCWSTAQQPKISDSKSVDGSGMGSFTSTITGLNPGTTYYVRAYATNSTGTSYGSQSSFATSALSSGLKFEKNVLLEQYTGTWCGYCTRSIAQIENLHTVNQKFVHIALHLSDAMTFPQNSALFSSFGFTGVPTVHTDRASTWNGNVTAIVDMQIPAGAGLAINVTGSGTSVSVTAQAKFGTGFPDGVRMSVYMLEDGIVANQANYYNTDPSHAFYGKGNPVPNFIHNNVLTKIGTDMFGDLIPAAEVGVGKVYSRSFTFSNISADKFSKLKVVAFLTHNSGSKQKQVINAVAASVGQNKGFVELP